LTQKGIDDAITLSKELTEEFDYYYCSPLTRTHQTLRAIKGDTVSAYLKEHPEDEEKLVFEMGRIMAKMHKIEVNGFGPFDNEKAQNGILQGKHSTLAQAVNAGLKENLERLVKYGIISLKEAKKMEELFKDISAYEIKICNFKNGIKSEKIFL
jgi:hypothetical protein